MRPREINIVQKFLSVALTLRGRLAFLICLATLPAILFTFYIAHNERSVALQRMEVDAHHVVNMISREHLYQMAGAKSLLRWLTDTLAKEEAKTPISDPNFLSALLAGYPQLANIAILSPYGNVINSAYPLRAPINMHDYSAVQRAADSHEIEVGTYVIGPIVKRPLLHLAYAIRNAQNNVRWIVFVAIDLEWLKKLTDRVELPTEHTLLIVDRDGRVLASSSVPDDPHYAIGQQIPELTESTQQKHSTIVAHIGEESRSFVTAPMEELPGVLVATALPVEQIYQRANHIFYRTLGWLSFLTLCTGISVLFIQEVTLLRSLRALSTASQRFGMGDYTARVSIPNDYGELKDMANAFNVMADTLTKRHGELTEAHRRLDRLTRHLQVARESEAQRIARDLHDEVGQVLTSIKMDLASFQQKCTHKDISSTVDKIINDNISAMQGKIDGIVEFIRQIASDLRPPVLDRMGLAAAIGLLARKQEQNSDIMIEVNIDQKEEPSDWLVSTTIYRIAQEALTNITRHAAAAEVHIDLHKTDDETVLIIRDDGKGIAVADEQKETLGIIGMRERARLVGGTFFIESKPGKGTVIKVTIPHNINKDEDHAYPVG